MKNGIYTMMVLAASTLGMSAENMYLQGLWGKGEQQLFSSPQAWTTQKGAAGRTISPEDTLNLIDNSGDTKIDGNFTVKYLNLGSYLAQKTPDGNITFSMNKTAAGGKDGSLTIDAAKERVKNKKGSYIAPVMSSAFAGVSADKSQKPLKRQTLTFDGGSVKILNSKDYYGTVGLYLSARRTPKTSADYYGGVIFNSPVKFFNDVNVYSDNLVFADTIGYQVCKIKFLKNAEVASEKDGKKLYRKFAIQPLSTNYFTPLMTVQIGDEKHPRALMSTGDFSISRGSSADIYGSLEINGDLKMDWAAELNIKKGGTLAITSTKTGKVAGLQTNMLARMNIDGKFTVNNPKIRGEFAKFVDCQIHVGPTGSICIDGSGMDGRNALYLEKSLLSLQKGATVYARNMVRLGTQARLQLFGENQISAKEPANKLCRLYLDGARAIVETHANQHFDGFFGNKPATLRLCDGTNEVRFDQMFKGKWGEKSKIKIEGFKNGVVKIDNDDPLVKTNVVADGWKDFRIENGFLTATKTGE